ncbi:MAG: hypothetical protein FWG92_08200, partial [Leptospirales bacterium]|nr:hypothetical protein [Leptospirales bacterium]
MILRPRRLRSSETMRELAAETYINPSKLIMPYFVCEGNNERRAIDAMPGIDNISIDNLLKDIESDMKLRVKSVLMFGIPAHKDEVGSEAYSNEGIIQRAV